MKANRSPNGSMVALLAIALLTLAACDKPLSAEERMQKAINANGLDASITAAMLVSALRSCQVVGVPDVDQCAQIKSPLSADQAAQSMATLAVEMRTSYGKSCQKEFAADYCNQLLGRAAEIEMRKPRS